ncbi:putative DNA-binding protein [Nosocomiicoccus massiliensis]|uniref:putative DNA-binding protein n=1 Tax=Nosocomiicoccus massiliensis TaxID=1232430 RepID=UPI0016528775|nr:putative DNA-binding protein [Nosocomiicoccus massiliensis]
MKMNELNKTLRMNYLYDFYNGLLTDKQKDYVKLYYLMDLQFSEIADELNVTRQAVYDNLKRTTEVLEAYEENLGMYSRYLKRQQLYDALKTSLDDKQQALNIIEELESLD